MDISKFDDYFAQVKARDARRTATKLTLDPVQPNDAAEGVQLGKELGVPPGQVMAAPQVFRERLAQERAAKALEQAPKLSDWLRNEPVAAAMAKDDLDNLSWFERNLGAFGRAAGRGTRRLAAGPDALAATEAATQLGDVGKTYDDILAEELAKVGNADPGLRVNAMMVARLRHDAIKDADPARVEEIRQRGSEALLQVREVMDRVQSIPMSQGAAAFRDGPLQSAENSVMGVLRAFGSDPIGGAAFLGETAAESLPVIGLSAAAAIATGSPVAAAGVAGLGSIASEGPSEFDAFLREKGVRLEAPEDAAGILASPELLQEAAGRGMTKGAVVGLFDALSAGAASKALLNTPVGNMLAQGLTQMLFGAGGEYASQKALGDATDWRDIVIEALAEGVTAPVEVAAMAGSRVRAMAKDAMRQPGQTAETLDQVSQQALASQLRARSPEDFKRAIEASGAGDQMIYVPADGLREYFQAKDMALDDEMLASLDIDPATFAEMEISGGRVALPMSSFATHIAGSDLEAWVRENATMDPDELALSEAASYADRVPADMADAYEQDVQALREEDARKASDVQVYDGIYGMLRAAGRGVEVATREAQVMAAYFRTQAERLGEDALDLAQRFNLDIRGAQTESPLPRRRGELDVLLNEIRSGVKDKPGDTLTQFVVGQGGIQDRGGDVGAIEGPKGLVAESATAIRERESMPTMPGLIPVTGKGPALDEMGRRAVEAGYFPELIGEAAGLNKGEAADLGRALLDALNDEASGRVRYREGEGRNEARATLEEALSQRGLDPAHMNNDEIAAALATESVEYNQDGALRTDSDAFRAWFGDSKVVDAAGKPLVVYHGTSADVDAFDARKAGKRDKMDPGLVGPGFYFGGADIASSFGRDGVVMPVYLSLQNPYIISDGVGPDGISFQQAHPQGLTGKSGKAWQKRIKAAGHDGVIFLMYGEPQQFVAFGPEQIKSVHNRGAWDPNDPRILYQSTHDKGGRAAPVSQNGDVVLTVVNIPLMARAFDRQGALARLADLKGQYQTASGESVTISRAARKIFSGSFPEGRLRLAGAIADLLKSAVVYNTDTPQRAYAVALANLDGQSVIVRMVLNDDGSGSEKLYALEGFESAPVAWRDAAAEVSGQEQVGATPAVGSAPEINVASAISQINALPADALPLYQQRRGSIVFPPAGPDGATTVINLFEAANLSTFFHEAGHFTLEVQAALAADPNAPQQMHDDMAAIRDYLGATEGEPFTVEQHETWARSLEAYLMEGKAPSLALADVFARVKAWLTRIYRTVAGLNVKLTPEIREVMDRMLATDAEIAEARADLSADPLFREKPPSMSEADWSTYQRMARRSAEQAEAKLLGRTMEAVRRKTERWWKDERKAVWVEVEARTNALPQYRLVEAMANGRYLGEDGEIADAPDVRIDRKLLVEQFGEGVLAELGVPRLGGKRAIYGPDGISPIAAAQMFGFRSAPDMIEILQNTGKRRDAIEAETDSIMLERHGDPFTDGSIEQEAIDAIHNEQTQNKHVAEARQMAQQLGRDTRGMTARHYRQRAARMLDRMTVREATAPARFLAAERKAGRDAERAFSAVARGNSARLSEALQAKEQQVLNAALYDLSRQAEKEVSRARERFRDYDKKSVREKLEGGYIEQIDAILDRYDFRKRGPGQVQRSETLAGFIQRMADEGREAELAIDSRLMDEARRVHYTRLPLDELRGLIDTVANLDHLGRMKQKLVNARRERDFAVSKERVIGQLEKVGRDAVARPRGQAAQALSNYLSLAKSGDTIIAELDGLEETGIIFDELRRDVFASEAQEAARRIEMEGRFSDLIKAHYTKAQITDMAKPRNVPVASGRLWAKSEILAVALNTGNESNFQRLTDENVPQERRLTRDQVQGMLATLDENDWRFVQGVWDMMDSYSGELEAVHKRRTGTKLKRVEPMMMVGAPSFVTGGYYPLKYDKDRSAFADRDEGSAWDRITGSGHGSRIEVASGMTVTRKSSARGRPVRLDLGVPIEGMRDTIRVITLSEAVDNSARLLRDGEVKQTFFDRGLQNEWRTLELWLEDIASGPIFHGDSLNVGARVLKNNLTLMFLSFNLKTTVLQVTGLAQSAAVIGKRNMAQGMMAYLRHPQDMVKQVSDASTFMRERQKTFHKDFTDRMSDPTQTDPIRGKLSRAKETMAQWGFAPIQLMQFYAVDVPTWAGAYRARLEAGDSHEAAAEYADLMVDRSQGGGFMGSRAAVSRGTLGRNARQLDFVRFFSTLGGYMITKYNRGLLEGKRGVQALRSDEPARVRYAMAGNAAINLALLYVVEAALMAVLWGVLTDEDEPEDYAKFMLKETGMAMIGGLPVVRDFIGGAVNGYGSGGMYQTVGEIPARILTQLMQGENDRAARSAFGSGVGAVTGLPTTATLRAIEGMIGDDDQTWADMFLGKNPLKD